MRVEVVARDDDVEATYDLTALSAEDDEEEDVNDDSEDVRDTEELSASCS